MLIFAIVAAVVFITMLSGMDGMGPVWIEQMWGRGRNIPMVGCIMENTHIATVVLVYDVSIGHFGLVWS